MSFLGLNVGLIQCPRPQVDAPVITRSRFGGSNPFAQCSSVEAAVASPRFVEPVLQLERLPRQPAYFPPSLARVLNEERGSLYKPEGPLLSGSCPGSRSSTPRAVRRPQGANPECSSPTILASRPSLPQFLNDISAPNAAISTCGVEGPVQELFAKCILQAGRFAKGPSSFSYPRARTSSLISGKSRRRASVADCSHQFSEYMARHSFLSETGTGMTCF